MTRERFERVECGWLARHAASVLTVFLLCSVTAQSQQRAPVDVPRNPSPQGNGAPQGQRAPEPPHVVNITVPPVDPKKEAEDRANRQREIAIQESLAQSTKSLDRSTQALVVVGFLQVLGLFVSLALTNKAANAARVSAHAAASSAATAREALELTEVADIHLEGVESTSLELTPAIRLVLVFKNYGRTRASQAKFVWFNWMNTPDSVLVDPPPPGPHIVPPQGELRTPSERTLAEVIAGHPGVTLDDVLAGRTAFGFKARIRYDDIFGGTWQRTYVATFDHVQGAWMRGMTESSHTPKPKGNDQN